MGDREAKARRLRLTEIDALGYVLTRHFAISAMVVTALSLAPSHVHAADTPANAADPFLDKLTIGLYHFAQTGNAIDVNLRRTGDYGNVWLGYYEARRRDEHQGRAGWDHTFDFDAIRVTASSQAASRGYLNGSIGVETGERWFVGAGFGRTNLRPNWNLNFDPNDSWTLSAGWRGGGESISLLWVRDDRQNPDQRHIHAVYRKSLPDNHRLTIDVLHKIGLVDDVLIHRTGATVTYDWPRFFMRLAFDPKVNFTPENMWRVSVGTRF